MTIDKLASSALKAVRKEEKRRDLPYEKVPEEILIGEELDLSHWSLVVTDNDLKQVKVLKDRCDSRLVILDLSGAQKITDAGLLSLSPCCSSLKSLVLDNIYLITGSGLSAITRQCSNLQQLSLSGTMGIPGASYSIIGQDCRELVTLKLSGCKQITTWAFMKIFEGCKKLKYLDISFCSLVTDEQIKILAECSDLRKCNLRECKQVSDVGLTFLSQGCPMLVEINLRRSELPFRVSDVSLLQLGQGCQHLSSLCLHGNEMLTDTGISWLASWSKELRHLDLSNCNKITNKGIRHIGEGCPKLKSIVLLNLKRVSDLGIRCLATGCPTLESLNASGLVMLSDGVDRTHGLEGLQALGNSKCNVHMKRLVLHGCNLISKLSLKAISNLVNLEALDLSGCNKLRLDGMTRIGRACHHLTQISLASCGDCVNDAIVESLVLNSKNLASMNLSYCQKIGERSLKALSRCKELRSVDLTGCTGVTDQAILYLCDGKFSPGLRHLFIAGCNKIGDTALAWITDGLMQDLDGSVSLETLSVKGTSITKEAAKGIADRFQFSAFKHNASYLGYWPLSRSDDRKIIKAYQKKSAVCTTIQARFRSRKEKETLRLAKEQYCKKKVALFLSCWYRGGKARKSFREMRRQRKLIIRNTMLIQCAFRMRMSKKIAQRMRDQRWRVVAPYASTMIQRRWRGILGRRRADQTRDNVLQNLELCLQSTIRIQAFTRMVLAKRKRVLLQCKHFTHELTRFRSSIKIQSCYRRYLAKAILANLKAEFAEQEKLRIASLSCISAMVRCRLFRRTIQMRIDRTKKRLKSTMLIQSWYRSETERWRKRILAEERHKELMIVSALLLQSNVRRRLAYLKLRHLKAQQAEFETLCESKATIVGRWARVCAARIRVQRRRVEHAEEARRSLIIKVWASTIIAAAWRGKVGRDLAKNALASKRHRWKALFDETHQLPFYYNKDTGETTWQKPQILLDAEPKPICSNCSEYQAELECRDCQEFFCTKCWEFIHRGGKRARHSFRTVYDYYGNRKDYDREPWIPYETVQEQS